MPRYVTTVWAEFVVQELQEIIIEATSLEEARTMADNPDSDTFYVTEMMDVLDSTYSDTQRYRPDFEATVEELPSITQAHSVRDNAPNIDGISWALGSTGSRLTPLRIVPLTGKVIPKGFTLKEYKIKDTNENLCTF